MPRYFFHRTEDGVAEDRRGVELGDLQDARIQAVVLAADTLRAHPDIVWSGHEMRIEVADEEGRLRFTVKVTAEDAR